MSGCQYPGSAAVRRSFHTTSCPDQSSRWQKRSTVTLPMFWWILKRQFPRNRVCTPITRIKDEPGSMSGHKCTTCVCDFFYAVVESSSPFLSFCTCDFCCCCDCFTSQIQGLQSLETVHVVVISTPLFAAVPIVVPYYSCSCSFPCC